jgi:hypothetical protein
LALLTASPAAADVHVGRGEVVSEVRVLGQDVRIDGRARGPVVVIAGDLTVGPAGRAANITVIGGKLTTLPGARLSGDVFQFGGAPPSLAGWRLPLALLLGLGVRTLLVWLAVVGAESLAATAPLKQLAETGRRAPGRTILAGVLATCGLIAASVLLALTVIALPAALMICGALTFALLVGLAVAMAAPASPPRRRGVFIALAIPVIGDALLALATALGVGALLRRLLHGGQGERATTASY